MTAIFKREFRDYFTGMFGWIFIAVLVLAGGVLSTAVNILSGSTDFSAIFATLPEVLIVLLPFLASQTFTKERAEQNELWLCSLPVRRTGLILGKYFAMLLLFLLPTALLAVFPPLLDNLGNISYGSAYCTLAGYVLMGSALLAICAFAASCLHNRIVSVIVGILICAVIYFAPVLASLFVWRAWIGYLVCGLICAGIGAWLVIRYRRVLPGVLAAGIPLVLFTLLYFLLPVFYSDFLPAVLDFCSLVSLLNGFTIGHFDVPTGVYYLSIAVLVVFLTVQLQTKPVRKEGKGK